MSENHDVSEAFEEWDPSGCEEAAKQDEEESNGFISGALSMSPLDGTPFEMADKLLHQAHEYLEKVRAQGGVLRKDLIEHIMAPIGAALVIMGSVGWNETHVDLTITIGPGKGRDGGPRAQKTWKSVGVKLPGSEEFGGGEDEDDDDDD